jgi:DNA-binding transcriptional LysR family regulator
MDTLLARTFLEVVAAGSFVGAANRLHVSQAAVSMRIQALESQLGCNLFHRGRGGARLTPAGRTFHRYAVAIKSMWDQARLEVTLPSGYIGQVRVGGHYSLWRHFLSRWFRRMRQEGSDVALRIEAHGRGTLMQLLGDGMLDIAILFDPEQRAGFVVEHLFEESLVLVSTVPHSRAPFEEGYMFVDWGPEFQNFHTTHFAELALPGLQTNLGAFAVEQILENGGSGYFPEPVVRSLLRTGRLHRVQGAPPFATPIYAVYRNDKLREAPRIVLDSLRAVAAEEAKKTGRHRIG